ncbi:hypothetical protein T439DRAFT_379706 [Meredithblackwellia eburnea MCA 4105]
MRRVRIATLLSAGSSFLANLPVTLASEIDDYSSGVLGIAPTQKYHSSELEPPLFNFLHRREDTASRAAGDEPVLTFMGYRGSDCKQPGPMLFDRDGELVWHGREFGSVLNVQKQWYRGEPVVTFYTGTEQYPGYGNGQWNILNQSYELVGTVVAKGTEQGLDPHDFYLEDDIATVEYWTPVRADLSLIGGPIDGWVFDCRVQAINLTSDELIFSWSALNHVSIEDSFYSIFEGMGTSVENAFDYFHLNSVQRDSNGNFVLGARGTSTVYYVSGGNGEIIWQVGGKNSDFSSGDGAKFAFQHDARLTSTGPTTFNLSLFDNEANQYGSVSSESRGLVLQLDTELAELTLLLEVRPTFHIPAAAEGSMQVTGDTNVVVGWGVLPHFTEYDSDGKLVEDIQFGTEASNVHSYRVLKASWNGRPRTSPSFSFGHLSSSTGFVSWNGDTETAYWQVMEGNFSNSTDTPATKTIRRGFETNLNLSDRVPTSKFVTIAALDSNGVCLGMTEIFSTETLRSVGFPGVCPQTAPKSSNSSSLVELGLLALFLAGMASIRKSRSAWEKFLRSIAGYSEVAGTPEDAFDTDAKELELVIHSSGSEVIPPRY